MSIRLPPPLCRRCLEAADVELFHQAADGVLLLYCVHHQVLARVTVADHVPAHWVCDHPCSPEAAERQVSESRSQAHQGAN
jgi:hypothetical protein